MTFGLNLARLTKIIEDEELDNRIKKWVVEICRKSG